MSDLRPAETDARLEREKSFHDDRFGHDGGVRKATAFYVINDACQADFDAVLDSSQAARVLEYGCGTGSAGFRLAAAGAEVVGIDISSVAVDAARAEADARGLTSITFTEANAEALDLPDASFDLVCGTGILHHLDLERGAAEVARVLRPGGRAVFLEPLGHNPIINLYRRLTPGMRTDDEHPLLVTDFDVFRRRFGHVETRSYVLLALVALALRRFSFYERALAVLNRADAALFRRVPFMARFAWTVVIELAEPRPAT